jgi:4-amino-4-deoxy-L-arabinose transferase-like glycosyltransferase
MTNTRSNSLRITMALGSALTALLLLRCLFPERAAGAIGLGAAANALFALGLLALVGFIAIAIGLGLIRRLRLDQLTPLEQILFAFPLGCGVIAYGVLLLGLIGWLRTEMIALVLALLAVLAWREGIALVRGIPIGWRQLRGGWRQANSGYKILIVLVAVLWGMALIQALTPPWDYDGLMYHLTAPQKYLQAGRLMILPDIWQANGPATPDMLYTLGLSFGTDTFAKLLHLLFGAWLVISVYALGKRTLGGMAGWLAAIMLMGMPIFFAWAGWAYTDMIVAVLEFLAVYAVMMWIADDRSSRWLLLAGLFLGFALGSKYLALGTVAIVWLWTMWHAHRQGGQRLIVNTLWLIVPAVLIALPWYARNLIETGNPLYPLGWGGPGWDKARLDLVMTYLNSFGTGHGLLDYVLLPINIFAQRAKYTAFWGQIEFLNPLFLLALLYPLLRRPRPLDGLAAVAAVRCVAWALGSQQMRFLLPVMPLLALLSSYVLLTLLQRYRPRRANRYATLSAAILLIVSLAGSIIYWAGVQPVNVVLGAESKAAYLQRQVSVYPIIQSLMATTAPESRALLMWNGLGYYCDQRCVPDPEQSRWTYWMQGVTDVAVAAQRLREHGITHLVFSFSDVNFFVAHDPSGQHRAAADFFWQQFRSACTRELFSDENAVLYEVTCR